MIRRMGRLLPVMCWGFVAFLAVSGAVASSRLIPDSAYAGEAPQSRQAQPSTKNNAPSLIIPLLPDERYGRQDMRYHCDYDPKTATAGQKALAALLPKSLSFRVSYYNGDMTALAVLPLDNRMLVMANIIAASGAKYVADRYIWWAEGDEAHFYRTGGGGDDDEEPGLSCHALSEDKTHSEKKNG